MALPNSRYAATHRAAVILIFACSTLSILLLYSISNIKKLYNTRVELQPDVNEQGVASLAVYIPPERIDDFYQIVNKSRSRLTLHV